MAGNPETSVARGTTRTRSRVAEALFGIVVLAVAVRWIGLGSQSFWYDESFTVHIVRGPVSGLLDRLSATESTPPLYYVLASGWQHLFGHGEAGLRSLSMVCGVALVPVVYLLARRVASDRAAAFAAALVATSPELVWMSQEARAYALTLLLLTASTLLALMARERASVPRVVGWALLAAGALASHYFAVFIVVPQAVWLLWTLRAQALWGVGIVAATGLALLPLAVDQRDTSAGLATGGQSLTTRLPAVPKRFLVGETASEFDRWWIVILMALLVGAGLVLAAAWTSTRERRALLPVAALAALSLGLPVVAALGGQDYVNGRNLLGAWPLVLVLVAAGFALPRVGSVGVAATCLLCALGVGVTIAIAGTSRLQRDDWRAAAHSIAARTPSAGLLLLDPAGGSKPLSLYLPHLRGLSPRGVRASDVEVVALTRGRGGAPPFVPPSPFVRVATTSNGSVDVVRYRAPTPQLLTPEAITRAASFAGRLAPEAVVWQRSSGASP
jgi:4-amino-4-deoxy-L-arabinose transferase-like glycosyltransferase